MKFNDIVAWLLRSPLHGIMSGSVMLVEVTGRKSGQPVRLPVNYNREGADLWVISSRDRVWWRNLQANPRAALWLVGQQVSAQAEVLLDEALVAARFTKLFAGDPRLAGLLKIRLDENGFPNAEDLQRLAHERLFVKFLPVS